MRLRNPAGGDYRPLEDSAAEAYGCRTFGARNKTRDDFVSSTPPPTGLLFTGTTVDVGGLISGDTTWDADLIRVLESVEIAENASLTITPGTRVEFEGFFRLLVRGRLWAVGDAENRIHFTAATGQMDEGWDGIDFLNIPAANDSSRLEQCYIANAVARPAKGGTARAQNGGAISIIGENKLAIASCIFENNRADYGAAIYCGYGSSPVLAGNLFQYNTAVWNGSVLFNVYAYPKLINNTLVGNTCLAESEFHLCGAVENFNGKIPLINNIIWYNFTNHHSGGQLVSPKDYYTLSNNIEGYEGNETNLDIEPGFLGEDEDPFQLIKDSICIDRGMQHALSSALAGRDLMGKARYCEDAIDLGAYEYCGELSPAAVPSPHLSLTCVPNPFNPRTQISFYQPDDGLVNITIYDLQGRRVRTLVDTWQTAGHHQTSWNGSDQSHRPQASGTYLYQLKTEHGSITRRMTLVR